MERQHRKLCVSEASSSSLSIEAQSIPLAWRRFCDRACGAIRFESIHADMAAELALASSGMTTLFPSAIFLAYSNCAGLGGLGASFRGVSPPEAYFENHTLFQDWLEPI